MSNFCTCVRELPKGIYLMFTETEIISGLPYLAQTAPKNSCLRLLMDVKWFVMIGYLLYVTVEYEENKEMPEMLSPDALISDSTTWKMPLHRKSRIPPGKYD